MYGWGFLSIKVSKRSKFLLNCIRGIDLWGVIGCAILSSIKAMFFTKNFNLHRSACFFMLATSLSNCTTLNQQGIRDNYKQFVSEELSKFNSPIYSEVSFRDFNMTSDDQELVDLVNCLKRDHQITMLNLECNCFGDKGIAILAEALQMGKGSIKNLKLGSSGITDQGLKDLAEAIKRGKLEIQELSIDHNKITHVGLEQLVEALLQVKTIEKLDLSFNQIDAQGLQSLTQLVNGAPSLRGLNVNSNQIQDSPDFQAFAQGVASSLSLKKIELSANKLDDQAVTKMAQAWLDCGSGCTIEMLDLSSNQIGDVGAQKLAVWLQNQTSLKVLSLHENHIAVSGVTALAEAVSQNTSLQTLSLHWNDFGGQGDKEVKQILDAWQLHLQQNTTLKMLTLCHRYPLFTGGDEQSSMAEVIQGIQKDLNMMKTLTKNICKENDLHYREVLAARSDSESNTESNTDSDTDA